MIITKKDKKNKSNKTSKLDKDITALSYKIEVIVKRYFGLIITLPAVLFLLVFVNPFNHPSESELVFEECTFIKYEYQYHDRVKGSDYEDYLVYVEEYDEALKISGIVFEKADQIALSRLNPGDKVTLSIKKHYDMLHLYSMSYGDTYILSYEDYLSENIKNDKNIAIICIILIFIGIAFSLIDVIYKKVKGKSLFWKEP